MKNLLTDIDLSEVSLVDKGANPGAVIMLYKRDAAKADSFALVAIRKSYEDMAAMPVSMPEQTAQLFADIMGRQEISEELFSMVSALHQSVCSILDDQELSTADRTSMLQQTFDEFHQAASAELAGGGDLLSKISAQVQMAKSRFILKGFRGI